MWNYSNIKTKVQLNKLYLNNLYIIVLNQLFYLFKNYTIDIVLNLEEIYLKKMLSYKIWEWYENIFIYFK